MRLPRRAVLAMVALATAASSVLTAPSTAAAPTAPAPAPSAPALSETAPTETALTESAPSEPAPTEPVPSESAPSEPAPSEPALTAPVPVPSESAPSEPAPTAPSPVVGDRAPSGATDGLAVGDIDRPFARVAVPTQSPQAAAGAVQAAAVTRRYFGSGPWSAISSIASRATKCSGLNADELRAMMVSPIFKESSGGTTASSAPAPMTLSRYDEWTGVKAGNTNANANYGLYAFRDPNTAYPRAYWHPGIGIWQYDTAGVGAPFTAVERMDVSVVGLDVAAGMRDRWCDPDGYIDHAAPFTETERRAAAWAPWWYTDNGGCPLCEQAYQEMAPNAATRFDNISTVPMSVAGGAVARSCAIAGVGSVTCWYIDPAVAQGANWWADLAPKDGGSSTEAPAPISAPFYVVKQAGYERRYWLRADTGYGSDITGLRQLGKNDRPKDAQSGSGIAWSPGGGLCDLTAARGDCSRPFAPRGVTATAQRVSGTYSPVVGDFDGNGVDDLLWYAPGAAADSFWINRGSGRFRSVATSLRGTYSSVLAGDLTGNKIDDLILYSSTTGALTIRRLGLNQTFTQGSWTVGTGLVPFLIDIDGDGRDELFLHGPGRVQDRIFDWSPEQKRFLGRSLDVNGTFRPVVGDFDGNGRQDIFWYAAGTSVDYLWLHRRTGGYLSVPLTVNEAYDPVIGDLDGDGKDDIVLKATSSTAGVVFFGGSLGALTRRTITAPAGTRTVVAELGTGWDDLLLVGQGRTADQRLRWTRTRMASRATLELSGTQLPLVGRFSTGGRDGIFWYGKGAASDWLWWR